MKRLCAVVTLMLLTNAAHAGTVYSLEVAGRSISIDISSGCDALDCILVTGRAARHASWRHGSAERSSGKTVSRRPARPSIRAADQRSETALPRSDVAPGASPSRAATPPSRSMAAKAAIASPPIDTQPADLTGTLPAAATAALPSPTPAPVMPEPSPNPTASADPKSDPPAAPAQNAGAPDTAPPARAHYAPHSPSSDVSPPALAYYVPARTPATAQPSDDTPSDHDHAALEGSWLTEDKSSVRIKPCGPYLCGYATNSASDQAEEEMLADLKPISSSEWVGMILNHDTGVSYPAIVISEGDNTLRVRSCGMGAAFCGGQVWDRAAAVTAGR